MPDCVQIAIGCSSPRIGCAACAVRDDDEVVAASEVRRLEERARELERLLVLLREPSAPLYIEPERHLRWPGRSAEKLRSLVVRVNELVVFFCRRESSLGDLSSSSWARAFSGVNCPSALPSRCRK